MPSLLEAGSDAERNDLTGDEELPLLPPSLLSLFRRKRCILPTDRRRVRPDTRRVSPRAECCRAMTGLTREDEGLDVYELRAEVP